MKRCRQCKKSFKPTMSSLQVACSPACAIAWAKTIKGKAHSDKAKRVDLRSRKQSIKTRSDGIKETQIAFNAMIRARDGSKPCISCGILATNQVNYWDCGHYRSTGAAPELRFEPLNAHKQCKQCNRSLSGNVVEYRLRLTDRIGARNLHWLEGKHEPKKYTIEDVKELKKQFNQQKKEYENGTASKYQ